jgi:hypothetical protein
MDSAASDVHPRWRVAGVAIVGVPVLAMAILFFWPTITFLVHDRQIEKTISQRLSGTSSGFDPVRERAIVEDCAAAYLSVADIGYERLKLPPNQVKAADEAAYRGFQRWKPLVRAAQQRTAVNLYQEAGAGPGFWRTKAAEIQAWIPGARNRAFAAVISRTRQCNSLADRWTPTP